MVRKMAETNDLLDIALKVKDLLKREGLSQMDAEIVCDLAKDRIRCERYYKTYDLDKQVSVKPSR